MHFIGIGGIGLSALARYSKFNKHKVSGSDIKNTSLINSLRKEGIDVYTPHCRNAISDDIDLVIKSAIVKDNNIEIIEAKNKNKKILTRREFLPFILSDKNVISVCGAHGKSTTTAIIASLLPDFTALIGAESKEFNSNFRGKESDYIIFEADESDGSFIDSNPYISVITNTEPEHMEYYNYDYDLFYQHYFQFLKKSKIRVVNGDDDFIKKLDLTMKKVSINDAKNIEFKIINNIPKTIFEYKNEIFEVNGFGNHLVLDALLAINVAEEFISLNEIKNRIKNFQGIKKRFDIIKNKENFVIIDDYAHHPTEIKYTLNAIKKFAKLRGIDKIIAIWQPHKYSRVLDNLESFVESFEGVSKLIILPVWAAGEEKKDIDFKQAFHKYNPIFSNKIKVDNNSIYLDNDKKLSEGIIVGFGAGDITYQLRGEI